MILEFVVGVILFIFLLHKYTSRNFDHWAIRGVDYIKPLPFIGAMKDRILMTKSFLEFDRDNYMYFKARGKPYGGYFEGPNPVLHLVDPDVIKNVTIKDFDIFTNRREFNLGDKIMSEMLTNLKGDQWRETRSIMTPAFSSGKMRWIFETIQKSSDRCLNYMRKCSKSGEEIEIKDFFGRFTMDVIATAAFGVECDCVNDPTSAFSKNANKVTTMGFVGGMLLNFVVMMPKLAEKFKFPVFDFSARKFFEDVIAKAISYRENIDYKTRDFLQLLLDARKGELENDAEVDEEINSKLVDGSTKSTGKQILTDSSILSQSILFFLAGYETTAGLLAFATYELAVNPDIQDKVYVEIKEVVNKHGGEVTYNAIMEMPYLDMVVSETQRKHIAVARIERVALEDYKVPNHDLVIEKDQLVIISVAGLHMDPEYYPDPQKFDPERFNAENKAKRNPHAFAPFGAGQRKCIGMRFALMETKAVLAELIFHMKFNKCNRTQIPMDYDRQTAFLIPSKGIWLTVEERKA